MCCEIKLLCCLNVNLFLATQYTKNIKEEKAWKKASKGSKFLKKGTSFNESKKLLWMEGTLTKQKRKKIAVSINSFKKMIC